MSFANRLLIVMASGVLFVNCDDTCPPGHVYTRHVCVAPPASTEGTGGEQNGPDRDADTGTGSTGNDAGNPVCTDSTFGKTCMTAVDCGCDTGFCAGYPGQAGICSHTGCQQDASICPLNWSCQDLSAYQAGLSVCTPPG
jgi:hypothetical protein